MYRLREGPRFEYREQVSQRVKEAPSLAHKYPQLKTLVVDLGHFNAEGLTRNSLVKFTPNLQNGKAVIRVDCPNNGCIRGDFDLTDEVANAVAERRAAVTGELCCQGWQSKTTIDTVPCHNILRYTINLTY